jgi:hypothetical protein
LRAGGLCRLVALSLALYDQVAGPSQSSFKDTQYHVGDDNDRQQCKTLKDDRPRIEFV